MEPDGKGKKERRGHPRGCACVTKGGHPRPGSRTGYLWSRSAESADVEKEQVIAENPPDGVRTSSPVLCAGCSAGRWLLGYLCQAKGDNERTRNVLEMGLSAAVYTQDHCSKERRATHADNINKRLESWPPLQMRRYNCPNNM